MHNITQYDLQKILDISIPQHIQSKIEQDPLQYNDLTKKEYDQYLIRVINTLTGDMVQSGTHRLQQWENGWRENLEEFINTKNIELLIPKYHGKHKYVRWQQKIIDPITPNFDYKIHTYIIDSVIDYYAKNRENIYEFGCGPAYHLLRLSSYYKNKNFYGLDWTSTSQKIIHYINEICNLSITGHRFDFYNPDYNFKIIENSLVYTIAALEQVGCNFIQFIQYLIDNKPKICIHLEPISEVLDNSNLIDMLSIKYFEKRKYLSGLLSYLQNLEKNGQIEIIDVRRTYTGSYFIEGHSLIVWRPV